MPLRNGRLRIWGVGVGDGIRVEVVDATGSEAKLRTVTLPVGATVGDAVDAARFGVTAAAIGVFGEVVDRTRVVEDGDRVDLLRLTLIDPMEARRQRVGTP